MSIEIFEPYIEPNKDRELVTFFLVSYKQEKYIREALNGAFAQTYQPLEIVLSDDCSPDGTFGIMREMARNYRGPHRLVLSRNERNLGLCGNVNRLLNLASGNIIVIAAGDDISLPERAEKSWRLLQEYNDATCVSFRIQTIDAEGVVVSKTITQDGQVEIFTLEDFIRRNGFSINGASRAFRRSVFTKFGPLCEKAGTEDSTTMIRCLMLGTALSSGDLGIYYRVHGGNYYASQNKFKINYKRIYWQYLIDMAFAVKIGVLTLRDANRLKAVLRKRLKENLLLSKYHFAPSKVGFYFSSILFSRSFTIRRKVSFLLDALTKVISSK